MRRHLNRRTWPLLVGGLVALAMLARHGGLQLRRECRLRTEAGDVA